MTKLAAFSEFLDLGVGEEYHQKRLDDFRTFSVLMSLLGCFIGVGLWIWDWGTDPIGAHNTITLRLLYIPLLLAIGLTFQYVHNRRVATPLVVGGILLAEILFSLILSRLNNSMALGIGGYLFFPLVGFILFAGISVRAMASYAVLCAALPQLLALVGLLPGFLHAQYALLLWPAALTTLAGHMGATQNYRRRYASEIALMRASHTDALTGAANRRAFIPLLQREILRSQRLEQPLSMLMLDVDHFKSINDTYGHPTGDKVICLVVETCRDASRQIDVVARLGGEEFAVLLSNTDLPQALVVAERIRAAAAALKVVAPDAREFGFTVSIGVTQYQSGSASVDHLLSAADAALYRAKRGGRNQVVAAA